MDELKKQFMHREICYLCFLASLGMAIKIPFYRKDVSNTNKELVKQFLRDKLYEILEMYSRKIDEVEHIKNIENFQEAINNRFRNYIADNGFTFGRAQKLINLYLKYIWVCGYVNEPPHCPIDSVIIKQVKNSYNGPAFNKMNKEDYKNVILAIKKMKNNLSIAEWELSVFNKR